MVLSRPVVLQRAKGQVARESARWQLCSRPFSWNQWPAIPVGKNTACGWSSHPLYCAPCC